MPSMTGRHRAGRTVRLGTAALVILAAGSGSALGQPSSSTLVEDMVRAVVTATEIAAQRDAEARQAQAASDTASRDAEETRARADEALDRAQALEREVAASEEARDAARSEAEQLRTAAAEKDAERATLQARADDAAAQARDAAARVTAFEEQLAQQRRRFLIVVLAGSLVVVGTVLGAWGLLRRRRRQLAESEAARREADEQLAAAVTPAPFSCLLEGTDHVGRVVVVKIEAAQLGSPDGIVVGRNPAQAGVVLDHPEASREHFRVTASHGTLSIEDLGSTNGTFVNGTEVTAGRSRVLSNGDEIGVGAALRLTLSIHRGAP